MEYSRVLFARPQGRMHVHNFITPVGLRRVWTPIAIVPHQSVSVSHYRPLTLAKPPGRTAQDRTKNNMLAESGRSLDTCSTCRAGLGEVRPVQSQSQGVVGRVALLRVVSSRSADAWFSQYGTLTPIDSQTVTITADPRITGLGVFPDGSSSRAYPGKKSRSESL